MASNTGRLRLAFMGSPDFAVPALHALHAAGHTVAAVYCQPPRPAGRGQAVRRCPVHVAADDLGLAVRTPARLRTDPQAHADFAALDLDVAVVAAYGLILPQAMLDAPTRGCLNIHASLLPRWRGAAPIHAAIRAGDAQTGITIMQMEAGLDTGPMLLSQAVPITLRTTTATLHDSLAEIGAELILQALSAPMQPRAQPEQGATYAPKLSREDGRIDWTQPADALDRQIRAFDPWPGSFTTLDGVVLKILAVAPIHNEGAQDFAAPNFKVQGAGANAIEPPGTVIDAALTIACGLGALRLTRVQLPGRGPLDAAAFLRGRPISPGTRLGT